MRAVMARTLRLFNHFTIHKKFLSSWDSVGYTYANTEITNIYLFQLVITFLSTAANQIQWSKT